MRETQGKKKNVRTRDRGCCPQEGEGKKGERKERKKEGKKKRTVSWMDG